jgi:hypothetical protein
VLVKDTFQPVELVDRIRRAVRPQERAVVVPGERPARETRDPAVPAVQS